MDLLLDTHIALWAYSDSPKLSEKARKLIENPENRSFISTVSAWEVSIKHKNYPAEVLQDGVTFLKTGKQIGLEVLDILGSHIEAYDKLNIEGADTVHKDPFDRMLIAQSKAENMLLLTHDKAFALYDEPLVCLV